ncbi:MAG: hypothetical protein WBF53_07370 [Litorimonas sp.]
MFASDDIARIGEGVRDRTLPKADWTHAAHIAAAVWLLDRHGKAAESVMPDMIRRYNAATGVPNTDTSGYHHTITVASLRAIRAAMGEGDLAERTNRVLAQGFNRPDWLFRHYSKARLFGVEARRTWVEPDLEPLPPVSSA